MKAEQAVVKAGLVILLLMGLAKGSYATEVKLSSFVDSITISGDMRLRHESFEKSTAGQPDRHRQRFRLRLGSEFKLPQNVTAKLRFASGTGEQVSTNQSFDNLSSQKGIWIDQAFLAWKPLDLFSIAGGRMENPIWRITSSDAVWDDDFNPEGFAQKFKFSLLGRGRFFVNALQMVVDEDATSGAAQAQPNKDQWMFGEQIGVEVPILEQSRIQVAGAYYEWVNERAGTFGQNTANEGNRRTAAGILSNDFGVAEVTGEVSTYIVNLPFAVQGTYIKNTKALDSLTPKEDTGYQIGAVLGKAKEDKSWELAYFYKDVETDATVADVADSDFGDGGTNRRGSILWAAYNPWSWVQFKAKYFITRVINESLAPGADDINRLQIDLSVKF